MSEEKATEKSPFETLDGITSFMDFSEVDGHKIKEWNTTQFTRLYPYLSEIASVLMEGGATFSSLKSYLGENWPKLVSAIAPHMVPIILISVPTITQEYLDEKPFTTGLKLTMAIFTRNIEHIADFFGQTAGSLPVDPAKSSKGKS